MTAPRQLLTRPDVTDSHTGEGTLEGGTPLYVPKSRDKCSCLRVNRQRDGAPENLQNPFRRTPAGMGTPKVDNEGTTMCGTPAMRGYSDPHPDTKIMGIKKAPMTCDRVACPNDYPHWSRITTFKFTVLLEARCHMEGTRPAHVTYGPKDTLAQGWDDKERQAKHKRRGNVHLRKVGVHGAVLATHDYRISGRAWRDIVASGWKGRKWDAVRENVLDLGDGPGWWRYYVVPGLHDHAFTVESWLKEHRCKTFNLTKIRYLETILDTVRAIRYAMSHSTSLEGERDRAVSTMGSLYNWKPDTDPDMDQAALLAIRREVAVHVGMIWNDTTKCLEYPPKEPVLGEEVPPEFKGMGHLHQDMKDRDWTATISEAQYRFLAKAYLAMGGERYDEGTDWRSWLPFEDWEPDVPEDIRVWGDPVESPPWDIDVSENGARDPEHHSLASTVPAPPCWEGMEIKRRSK